MIKQYQKAKIVRDFPEYGLKKGDIGFVIELLSAEDGHVGYMVDFYTPDGDKSFVTEIFERGDIEPV